MAESVCLPNVSAVFCQIVDDIKETDFRLSDFLQIVGLLKYTHEYREMRNEESKFTVCDNS